MWKKIPNKNSVYFSIGLCFVLIVVIIASRNILPPVVPLFYGLPKSQDQLVPSTYLVIAPIMAMVVTVINVVMCNLITNDFLKKVLILSSLLISILIAITVIKIILLVGFF